MNRKDTSCGVRQYAYLRFMGYGKEASEQR
jgi:hypothetical protein